MKSKIHYRPLLNLVTILVGVPSALGQTPPTPPPAPVAPAPLPGAVNVSMKLDLVSWAETIRSLQITSGGKGANCTAKAFEYSKPISYSGSSVLEIKRDLKAASGNTAESKIPVPAVDPKVPLSELEKRRLKDPSIVALALLPPGSMRATVLLTPAAGGTYNTFVIDDDPSKLPFGKLRIHNYCNFPIAVRCNNKDRKELKPKETTIVSAVNSGVIYELTYWKDGKWVAEGSNIITVEPTTQVQMVVLKSEANYFTSSDGSRGSFVQSVTLRRDKSQKPDEPTAVEN